MKTPSAIGFGLHLWGVITIVYVAFLSGEPLIAALVFGVLCMGLGDSLLHAAVHHQR